MYHFILGASDPEMSRIQDLLEASGIPFTHALGDGGRRVFPGNAYRVIDLSDPIKAGSIPVWVECGPADPSIQRTKVVDHHHPGDPGYGQPPAQFLPASSLGQTIALLASHNRLPRNWTPFSLEQSFSDSAPWYFDGHRWYLKGSHVQYYLVPMDLVLSAAADHCLGHAYRGLCPGVSPDDLRLWRAKSRAERQQISVSQIAEDVESAMRAIRALPVCSVEGFDVRVTKSEIKELQEASAILGEPVMYTKTDRRSGRIKVGLLNGCTEQTVAWMHWARNALADVYGDPARGFAGGYLCSSG